jgi:hypothetical protein
VDANPDHFPSGVFTTAGGGRTRMYFIDSARPLSPDDDAALAEAGTVIRQAHDLCAGAGARFLVTFIPTKLRVYARLVHPDSVNVPAAATADDFPRRLAAMVAGAGEFLDLTPALEAAARRGVLTYFPGYDTHWSPAGHRTAAHAIARFLEAWQDRDGWTLTRP